MMTSVGCAGLRPKGNFTAMGEANPEKDEEVMKAYKTTGDQVIGTDAVTVFMDTIPEGITFSDGKVGVEAGYNHEVLGKFDMTADGGHIMFMSLMGFPDYRSSGMKTFCYPQTVLNYLTLTMWMWFSPTAWPCYAKIGGSRTEMLGDIRNLVHNAGGDLAIAGYVTGYDGKVWGASGYVIKMDPKLKGKKLKTNNATLSIKKEKSL